MTDESGKKTKPSGGAAKSAAGSLDELVAALTLQRNLFAHIPHTSALVDALAGIEASSKQWSELSKEIDWGKAARLQAEAMKAMDFASKVQLQTDALKAFDWDANRLPAALRVTAPTVPSEETAGTLEAEIRRLRDALAAQSEALLAEKADAEGKEKRIAALHKTLSELRNRERLAFLLNQVHPAAQPRLEGDEDFRNRFLQSKDCTGFVLSVDIRRSTDLMLKARSPEQFAAFIGSLSTRLTQIVLESFGVFDKFTGDGILAFFPDFYSGPDAGHHALSVAARCHEAFASHYRQHRHAFISVLQDVGLGIGLDFGRLHLVQVAGALTVVGHPVVYACRLSGAPSGTTLLNQQAFDALSHQYGLYFSFEETSHEFKHEGKTVAYRVRPTGKPYDPQAPDWFTAATPVAKPKDQSGL